MFDTLPESAQRALLEGAIDAPAEMRSQFQSMLTAWTSGDVAAISTTFNEDLAGSPELREALLRRRNDSVVAMLQRDGYKVRRVQ